MSAAASAGHPFSGRIARRARAWNGEDTPGVHALDACLAPLDRDAPESAWRCCPYWPRKLRNKWTAREFAARHGVAVPELYWRGRDPGSIPFDDLPDDYVIRPSRGWFNVGVHVIAGGRDLMHDRRARPAALVAAMRRRMTGERRPDFFWLVEQRIPGEDAPDTLPASYKFHVFGGEVALVQRNEKHVRRRFGIERSRIAVDCFGPNWSPVRERLIGDRPSAGRELPRPAHFDAMLAAAVAVGAPWETYVRVDLYATPAGPVFGEFTATPRLPQPFAPAGEIFFESCWARAHPNAL